MVSPPMLGSSGRHYSENSALSGDGNYAATVTVGVSTFAREVRDKGLGPSRWSSTSTPNSMTGC